jgi:hypothetical protein
MNLCQCSCQSQGQLRVGFVSYAHRLTAHSPIPFVVSCAAGMSRCLLACLVTQACLLTNTQHASSFVALPEAARGNTISMLTVRYTPHAGSTQSHMPRRSIPSRLPLELSMLSVEMHMVNAMVLKSTTVFYEHVSGCVLAIIVQRS